VFFATDCIEDMHVWMQAMRQASTVQLPPGYVRQLQVHWLHAAWCRAVILLSILP